MSIHPSKFTGIRFQNGFETDPIIAPRQAGRRNSTRTTTCRSLPAATENFAYWKIALRFVGEAMLVSLTVAILAMVLCVEIADLKMSPYLSAATSHPIALPYLSALASNSCRRLEPSMRLTLLAIDLASGILAEHSSLVPENFCARHA